MNVSMIATPVAGDAGGNSSALASKDEAGGEFGFAVKDVEQRHGRKTATAGAAGAAGRHRAEAGNEDEKAVEGGGNETADGAADDKDGATNAGDVLGRILSASFLSSYGQLPANSASDGGNGKGEETAEGGGAQGELEERIVISTIADLAGSQGEDQPKRIALRVTGMETHFEPHQDAPKLVDVEPAAAATLAGTALAADGAGQDGATIRTPFAEVLRRLDADRSDKTAAKTPADAGGDGRPSDEKGEAAVPSTRGTARRSTDNRSEGSGAKPWTPTAVRVDAANDAGANGGQTTGQIINAQLAERIIGAFADQSAAARETSATPQSTNVQVLRLTAGGAALKTLSIQLEPQDLGRVDVSMRLVDGRLTVELAASEPSTAATLAGDRHGLRKILEHAGFALDDAAITIVARDTGMTSSMPTSSGDTGAGRQSSPQGQAFGDPDGNRRDAERRSQNQRRSQSSDAAVEDASTAARRGGSVYL